MLRSIALVVFLAVPASASELLTEVWWQQSPMSLFEDRMGYQVSAGNSQPWILDDITQWNQEDTHVADASLSGWDSLVNNLHSGSDLTITAIGQGGTRELVVSNRRLFRDGWWKFGEGWWSTDTRIPSLAGYQIDRLEFQMYYYDYGELSVSIFGTAVPEPKSLTFLLTCLPASFLLRRRAPSSA